MKCFLDRDGVINIDYPYVGTIDRFTWCPHIFDILELLRDKGYQFILITNQSGLNRNYYSYSDFLRLSFYMLNRLSDHSIELEINYCRHKPEENCKCRKPEPGMLNRYSISDRDIFIGDKPTDMIAALRCGIRKRFLLSSAPSGPYTEAFASHASLLLRVGMLT
jgi:D-glycero-D-manno-heptose 1,7-bisphosphate phosphatase